MACSSDPKVEVVGGVLETYYMSCRRFRDRELFLMFSILLLQYLVPMTTPPVAAYKSLASRAGLACHSGSTDA